MGLNLLISFLLLQADDDNIGEYRYHANKEGKNKSLSSITVLRKGEVRGSIWSDRFLKSAIVQGSIVTGLAIIFVAGVIAEGIVFITNYFGTKILETE